MKVLTVIGARPQFIKAAMLSKAFAKDPDAFVEESIVHTGQHYDANMSEIFFTQMGIPKPERTLSCGGGSHGAMTGRMLEAIESAIVELKPDAMLVYGDTNSTLAGALAAAKLHIPVIHVEAGLRSFNKLMPEELNRVLTDHLSSLLLCPTSEAVANLKREGIEKGVRQVGDVMYDAAVFFGKLAEKESGAMKRLGLTPKAFTLCTLHRAENTDSPDRLKSILSGLNALTAKRKLILPLHPRTKARIAALGLESLLKGLTLAEPLPFLDMVALERQAQLIVTDSGGVQKEAFFHKVPCITLRNETEWVETVKAGWNRLCSGTPDELMKAAEEAAPGGPIDEYGDGNAAEAILAILKKWSPS